MAYSNLAEMFYRTAARFPHKTGMLHKRNGQYKAISFREMAVQVSHLACGLMASGVKSGDRVVLLSENRVEWAFSDYAILASGAVTVPGYANLLPANIQHIINDCRAKIVVVSNAEQFKKLQEIEHEIPLVEKIILMDPEGLSSERMVSFRDVLAVGQEYLLGNPEAVTETVASLRRDMLATIVYTSGTTGAPKGVMLSHGNLLSNVEASIRAFALSEADTFLSFLPLSHVLERMTGHFLANHVGAAIAYAESIQTVPQNLLEVRPTIVTSVPRLFEKMYARVMESLEAGPTFKRKLFYWAIDVGRKAMGCQQAHDVLPAGLKFKYALANALVFSKLKERVGGRIRFFISGGAPLAKDIAEFFGAAGLMIMEGYGLSETSPVISVNRLDNFKFGSVGIPFDNVEVKIAQDGEILTRGPHVMQSYYKNEKATREAIDDSGWFYTGDIGHIDGDGFLLITDRKKNIIVTAGGKNVAPQKIENKLLTTGYVEQVLAIGDKRKFCSALIVPDFDRLEKFARGKAIDFRSRKELCRHDAIIRLFEIAVETANQGLASYESIKKFILLDRPFTIETGELTPSLKVKRKVVEKNYREQIDALYAKKMLTA